MNDVIKCVEEAVNGSGDAQYELAVLFSGRGTFKRNTNLMSKWTVAAINNRGLSRHELDNIFENNDVVNT